MDEATIAGLCVYNSIQAEAGIHGLHGHGRMAGGDPWLHSTGSPTRPAHPASQAPRGPMRPGARPACRTPRPPAGIVLIGDITPV
jgi:hypothetical protein